MHGLKDSHKGSGEECLRRSAPVTRAQGERRRFPRNATGSPYLSHLSLAELRQYRAGLRAEDDRVAYWWRLGHARLDMLEAGKPIEGGVTLEQLVRVLGDTGSGRARGALMAVRSGDPLPDLPVLCDTWVDEQELQDAVKVATAVRLLREALAALSTYQRLIQDRIAEATGELIDRYRANPASALQVLGA